MQQHANIVYNLLVYSNYRIYLVSVMIYSNAKNYNVFHNHPLIVSKFYFDSISQEHTYALCQSYAPKSVNEK